MCGIIGSIVTNPKLARDDIQKIYDNQKHRGKEGAGFAILRKGRIQRLRTKKPENMFKHKAFLNLKRGDLIILHHRFPTSSPNEARFNHPIANETKDIVMIHNGHISNDLQLFEQLLYDGHEFETLVTDVNSGEYTFTDSEVILHLIEDENLVTSITELRNNLMGSYAIAVMKKGFNGIYLHSHGNPIQIYTKHGNTYFSSELPDNYSHKYTLQLDDTVIISDKNIWRVKQ